MGYVSLPNFKGRLHCWIETNFLTRRYLFQLTVINVKELTLKILTKLKTYLKKVLRQQSNKNLSKMAIFSTPTHTSC